MKDSFPSSLPLPKISYTVISLEGMMSPCQTCGLKIRLLMTPLVSSLSDAPNCGINSHLLNLQIVSINTSIFILSKSYCVKISLKIFWLFLAHFLGVIFSIIKIIFLGYTFGSIFTIITPYFLRKLIISPISQSAYESWLQKLAKNKSSWAHE